MVLRSEGWRGEAFEDNGVSGVEALISTQASLSALLVKSDISLSELSDSAQHISNNSNGGFGHTNHSRYCICWRGLSLRSQLQWARVFFCDHIEAPQRYLRPQKGARPSCSS